MAGIQQAPVSRNSTSEAAIQGSAKERPVASTSSRPVPSWITTAGAEKTLSASTTWREMATVAAASSLRHARHMKKAMPAPVPTSTIAERTCNSRSSR